MILSKIKLSISIKAGINMTLQKKAFIVRCFARAWWLHNERISSIDEACALFVRLIINKPLVGMCVCDCSIRDTRTTECHWFLSTPVCSVINLTRNVSRIPATFKTKFLINLTKSFILDITGVHDTPLMFRVTYFFIRIKNLLQLLLTYFSYYLLITYLSTYLSKSTTETIEQSDKYVQS